MAIVVVQVGQCGNQLGDELFTQIAISVASAREVNPHVDSPFFCHDGMARCVLVDSEPKVVSGVRDRHPAFIRPENVVCGQSGRGNNWGMGFHGVKDTKEPAAHAIPPSPEREGARRRRGGGGGGGGVGGGRSRERRRSSAETPPPCFQTVFKSQRKADDELLTKALRAIHMETRRTAECEDGFEAILILHSVAGGTGSGLASRLAQKIRFFFVEPRGNGLVDERHEANMMLRDGLDGMLVEKRRAKYLVSIAVAPQACGELAPQGINAVLTLYTMRKYTDAILLLRNDDVMAPSGAISRSTTKTTTLIQRCTTFKEANEVLVALLLPCLQYGTLVGGRRGRGARGGSGVIATLVRSASPTVDPERALRITGGNTILTLLPTPQNTYEGYRSSVFRCVFFTVTGGKSFLPGCSASLPIHSMCAAAVLRELQSMELRHRQRGDRVKSSSSSGDAVVSGGKSKQVRLSQSSPLNRRGGGGGGAGATRGPRANAVEERPAWDSETGRTPQPPDTDAWDQDSFREQEEDEREAEGQVYSEVAVALPRRLLEYYREVKRSPVSSLATTLEGVALLNQVRELNRSLLFPLLRSAACKVRVGAFLAAYENAGVSSDLIVKAYQSLAEVLSFAEEL